MHALYHPLKFVFEMLKKITKSTFESDSRHFDLVISKCFTSIDQANSLPFAGISPVGLWKTKLQERKRTRNLTFEVAKRLRWSKSATFHWLIEVSDINGDFSFSFVTSVEFFWLVIFSRLTGSIWRGSFGTRRRSARVWVDYIESASAWNSELSLDIIVSRYWIQFWTSCLWQQITFSWAPGEYDSQC